MKKLFIIANWKSNKLQVDAIDWLEQAEEKKLVFPEHKTVIVCPSFTLLSDVSFFIKGHALPLSVGSQDISPYPMGAYTGAIHGEQIKEFCDYTIIGHSERRRFFQETNEMLSLKVTRALAANLLPIYCVQGKDDPIPTECSLVAYEPVTAIGTGKPDTPENANAIAREIKTAYPHVTYVLYGGSVTPENVAGFCALDALNGVLVGGASLDPDIFLQLAQNA